MRLLVRGLMLLVLSAIVAGCQIQVDDAPDSGGLPWTRLPSPELPQDRPLTAGFLVLDGVYNTELTAPYDLFHHTPFHTEQGIEVFTVSPSGKSVTTFEGLVLQPRYGFHDAPEIDILVIPSAEGNMDRDLEDEELLAWVADVGARARYTVTLCDGAFVLAASGLLDGHHATTFPGDQGRFGEMFPELTLEREPSFVHDGQRLTSQGGAKSFDVAMYLIDLLYGEQVAQGVGRGLIIDWPPSADDMRVLVVE